MKKALTAKKAAFLGFVALTATAMTASAAEGDPVSISSLVTSVKAQATSIISEALPFVAIVIGGTILFKLTRKFIR